MNAAERMKALAWAVWRSANATQPRDFYSQEYSLHAFRAWWEANADKLVCPACNGTGCVVDRSGDDLACPLDCKQCCGSPGWGLV